MKEQIKRRKRPITNIELSEPMLEQYALLYGNMSFGARMATTAWMFLRPRLLEDLKGRFTEEELGKILEAYYRKPFDPDIEFLHTTVCIRLPSLVDKVNTLSQVELVALVDWAHAFSRQTSRSTPEYLADLL